MLGYYLKKKKKTVHVCMSIKCAIWYVIEAGWQETSPIKNIIFVIYQTNKQNGCHNVYIQKFQGSRYRSPLSPNAKKKYFWHKKTSFGETSGEKKFSSQNIGTIQMGCFMSLNRQLTSWITCLKSVADQLIHDDNNSPHCLQLLKHVKLFFFFFFFFLTQSTSVDTC